DILKPEIQEQLNDLNSVIIPHGSLIEYVGATNSLNLNVPLFGNKQVLEWESDRHKEQKWFEKAGIRKPKTFNHPSEIDRFSLVKFPGACGGRGYVLVKNGQDFKEKVGEFKPDEMFIQEYILGTRFYPAFFYSPLTQENELNGIDIRYETNADGLARMPTQANLPPTYVVTGNHPVVMRESLLPKLYEMADSLTDTSKELFNPGMLGPYCIEMVCTDKLEMIVFEISARIVAGTNVWIPGSPYSYLKYGKNVSMGRRIAMEIKHAIAQNRLNEVVS
ncbi:MAG: formate--phosphoribosylaminoimidazolecarboxamide ligase, partial [Candidatus Diapherotrites archaeon]|nr:formate--phosphoribosylaminoimidazolecarboxamide ligase [Candidatus Diapherotrites archaeon]